MKCTHPILIRQDTHSLLDYTYYKNSKGDKFAIFGRYVPCGQCMACRLNYGKLWSIRMMEELKKHDKACFVTLTYDPEHLPDDNGLHKEDLQNFWKRLRKERSVRYFCCGEHGDRFNRPHYHAIIYGISPDERDLIQKHWQQGLVHVGTVTADSCSYVAKYMTKKLRGKALQQKLEEDPDYQNEFVLMSRRPGIGADLSPQMIKFLRDNGVYYRKGSMSGLPRYWKDKFDVKNRMFFVDPDEENKILTSGDEIDKLYQERLKFFKRKDS